MGGHSHNGVVAVNKNSAIKSSDEITSVFEASVLEDDETVI